MARPAFDRDRFDAGTGRCFGCDGHGDFDVNTCRVNRRDLAGDKRNGSARPDTTRVWDLSTHFRKAMPDVVTLPQLFRDNGYVTQSMGKIFHHGFDDPASWSVPSTLPKAPHGAERAPAGPTAPAGVFRRGPPFRATPGPDNSLHDGELADMAVAALTDLKTRRFFLAVGFIRPHLPFVSPQKYWDLYDPQSIRLAPNPLHPRGAPSYSIVPGGELRSYGGVPVGRQLPAARSAGLQGNHM